MMLLLILSSFLLCSQALAFGSRTATPGYLNDDPKPEVLVKSLELQEIYESKVFGGFIESEHSRPAAPEVAGTIDQFLVHPGQRVKKGQTLFLVKPRGLADEFQHHSVPSPLSGIISSQLQEVGAFIQPGDAVLEVANPDRLIIRFDAALQDVMHLSPGITGEVTITEPGVAKHSAKGVVFSVSPASHPELRTYQVYMRLVCPKACPPSFRLGAFARITIKENLRKGFRISNQYLHNNGKSVFIVTADDKLQEISIAAGKSDGTHLEITSGLKPGMNLVTSFSGKLKDGREVNVKRIEEERQKLLEPELPLNEH